MTLDRIALVRGRVAGILGAVLVVGAIAGCAGGAVAPAARVRFVGEREWPLSQGSRLTVAMKEQVIDEFSGLASIVVRHARPSADQKPVEKLEMRFANPGDPPDWIEIPAAAPQDGTQTFELPFSAPLPHTFDFRVTIDGKAEELLGWRLEQD